MLHGPIIDRPAPPPPPQYNHIGRTIQKHEKQINHPIEKNQSFHSHFIVIKSIKRKPRISITWLIFCYLKRFYRQNQPANAFFSILGSLGVGRIPAQFQRNRRNSAQTARKRRNSVQTAQSAQFGALGAIRRKRRIQAHSSAFGAFQRIRRIPAHSAQSSAWPATCTATEPARTVSFQNLSS